MKHILIVEDDKVLNQQLNFHLTKHGFFVQSVFTYEDAYDKIKKEHFELIILDIALNHKNGLYLCPIIKETTNSAVIFLSAKDSESDILCGYDSGADDYITKPFSVSIFFKKIEAIMKRLKLQEKENIYVDGFLTLNFTSYTAAIDNKPISLTPLEFKTLNLLYDNSNQILTRQIILEKLWDSSENYVDESSLNAIISRIRKKIELKSHKYIKTVYGIGYMWIGEKIL